MVEAESACAVTILSKQDTLKWLKTDPDFSLYLLQELSRKLLGSTEKLVQFSMLDLRQRYLFTIYTHKKSGALQSLSKQRLAKILCAPIRSLNRIVAQNGQLIQYKNGRFAVVDDKLLAEFCTEIGELVTHQ